jgi:hypothetical protein
MKQEDKDLLLKDLCARLPYEVKCDIEFDDKVFHKRILMPIMIQDFKSCKSLKTIKPYLFPLSSMTDEQEKEWRYTLSSDGNITYTTVDWLNKNHFDYRGLIPMGLANDATNLNIY